MRYLALRVRGGAIEVAVADGGRQPITWIVPDRPASIRRLVKLVSTGRDLRACCEDGPRAYELFWQLAAFGVCCDVVVPRGDAVGLVSAHRAGEARLVWDPTAARAALAELTSGRDFGQEPATARPVRAPGW